jgi:hypothetical protein
MESHANDIQNLCSSDEQVFSFEKFHSVWFMAYGWTGRCSDQSSAVACLGGRASLQVYRSLYTFNSMFLMVIKKLFGN